MPLTNITAAVANLMVQTWIVPGTTYQLSWHTANPGTTGASEVTGGSYIRENIVFAAASGGVEVSNTSQAFTGMPAEAGNLYPGLWTAGGTFLGGSATFGVTGPVAVGATITVATGAVTVTVSG